MLTISPSDAPIQTPHAEGHGLNRFLFQTRFNSVSIVGHRDNSNIFLEAGSAHGISPSTVFAIFNDPLLSCATAQLGRLQVARNDVGEMTSRLSFISEQRHFRVPNQFYAREISGTKIRIFCDDAQLNDMLRELPSSERLDIVQECRELDHGIRIT